MELLIGLLVLAGLFYAVNKAFTRKTEEDQANAAPYKVETPAANGALGVPTIVPETPATTPAKKAPAKKPVTAKSPAVKKAPAKKTATKKAPAKKTATK